MDTQKVKIPYQLTAKQKKYLTIKRTMDIVLSSGAIVVFSPLLVGIAVAIKIDSPGPVLFKQKRVGKNKELFEIYKFRTMRTDTPNDMPTHMLSNPERYITKVGKFLRKTSLDELPQLFNIWKGEMYVIAPRPALWNQYDLMEERDKYGVHQIAPGLAGWAQINGRDKLEIPDKARYDGEYIENIGFWMDLKCFFGTIGSVLSHDGVVEGGTGEINKRKKDTASVITSQKKILITGANSYIGMSVENWLKKEMDQSGRESYQISTLDMLDANWSEHDFSNYDTVYHVAGIAHADVGNVTEEQKQLYYKINTDLTVEVARKAKAEGVKQFIFMSSMIIYSGCRSRIITRDTVPNPLNFYGDSKWQADRKVRELENDSFKVVVVRPPMIYGKNSRGNYPELARLAVKLPFFPIVKNRRSMLYIGNLCQFIKLMIDNEESGVFFPQNREYTNTSDMVQMIAKAKGHRIRMVPFTNLLVKMIRKVPGKIGMLAEKAFGDLVYEMGMSEYKDNYRVYSLEESVRLTEK